MNRLLGLLLVLGYLSDFFGALAPVQASYTARIPGWENTSDDVIEFPAPKGLTIVFDGSSDLKFMRDARSTLNVALIDDGSPSGRRSDSLRVEVEGFSKPSPSCMDATPQEGRLDNGWNAAWIERQCRDKEGRAIPIGLVVYSAEGRRYLISGVGFSLAEVLAFAGRGRIIPPERRPTEAGKKKMEREAQEFAGEVDRVSGGPQIRSHLLFSVAAAVGLMLATVFLWRGGAVMRIVAVVLWLFYALRFGLRLVMLCFIAFSGVPLYGYPGPLVILGVAIVLLGGLVLAWVVSRSLRSRIDQPSA